MDQTSNNSSAIKAIGYYPNTGVLEVQFIQGSLYHYYKVPFGEYIDFLAAPSKGQHFNKRIYGKYTYERV